MAATQFENGPHVAAGHIGPHQPVPQPNPGTWHPVHGPEGSGPHLTDHQPHPHVHQSRPYFYVQPPPPLPLYHYQWPMPYNPCSGIPGYGMPGMVMPPFLPHPYMEVPGYVLPHSQLHPAEYRQYQFRPAAMAYQNNSRMSSTFYHNATPIEMVNSEVQTEPPPEVVKDGPPLARLLARSDFGRGTNSTTPSSLSSKAEKQSCPEEEPNSPIASKTGFQGILRSQGTGKDPPAGTKTMHSRSISIEWMTQNGLMVPEDVAQELSERVSDDHPNQSQMSFYSQVPKKLNESVWSVQSLAPYVPSKELLLENGIVVTEKEADPSNVSQDLAASQVIAVTERRRSLRFSLTLENVKEAENMADVNTSSCQESFHYMQIQQKANASVWSVQSLAPYVPSTEWLIQNGILDHEVSNAKESDANVSRGHTASQLLAITERSQRLSLSSVDTLPPYVPFSCLLADMGKMYYRKHQLGTAEHKQVFSTPMDKFIPSKRLNSEALPRRKRQLKHSHNLHMELVEKGSPTSQSAMIPSVEGSLNSTQGSVKPKAQRSPNQKALKVTEPRVLSPPCFPDDPEPYSSKCLAGDKAPGCRCTGRCNQKMEAEVMEPAKQARSIEPSRQDCEQIADVRMPTAPSSNGHFKTCGLMCSKLQERNCYCEVPKPNGVSFRKRHTGRLNKGNVAKMAADLIKPQAQQRLIPQYQKRQMDSRGANKAMPDHVTCDNGYGLNYSKKRRRWQNRPQEHRLTHQTSLLDSRTPRGMVTKNPGLGIMADLVKQEEQMEETQGTD
ncbi:uncharacterized protein LOC109872166 isoform X2 [Oncorhynchus kisutch]|uniref:uncharacterized protein LOC109872166 isoform X2 n=1 Tax=Oncorhynchus kisutch TaxID=8019 RepID=UPI0012DD0410|nr:uncharacterized protein LOC109872166 isoform X2 [Oncorhynchus kisutch]